VDEAGLLEQARRGDAEAFSRLFAGYQGPIYRYAAHMCGRESADDVVQETFLALLRDPMRFDPARGTLGGYLFGIARHHVFRRLRARRAAETVDDLDDAMTDGAAGQPTVLDQLTRTETISAVRDAITSLPPIYREVVVLCELQEMSYVDAAAVVACPVGTVRSRLAAPGQDVADGQAGAGRRRAAGHSPWVTNMHDPDRGLASVLRAIADEDRQLGASPLVEARLLQEVHAIARARRIAALKTYVVAAVLVLAVAGSVWSVRGPMPIPGSAFQVPGSVERTTDFYPLHYSNVPAADPQIVRLEVSRAALASFGLETSEAPVDDAAATVLADVIVGADGLARAIRFVWPPSDARLEEQRQ
jgi:RNA polymerase sigma-70 factor (ECF subfamily)